MLTLVTLLGAAAKDGWWEHFTIAPPPCRSHAGAARQRSEHEARGRAGARVPNTSVSRVQAPSGLSLLRMKTGEEPVRLSIKCVHLSLSISRITVPSVLALHLYGFLCSPYMRVLLRLGHDGGRHNRSWTWRGAAIDVARPPLQHVYGQALSAS